MSAISPPAQPNSSGDGQSVPASDIDVSCRAPILLLLLGSVAWLLVASVLGMIATLKFHAPGLLADCSCLTYGRVHPAQINAFIYGFAIPAGLGVALWLVAHLGRARLALGPTIILGALLWNLGLVLGLWGILYGESTGFEWLEFPRYAAVTLFLGYSLIALGGLVTLHQRSERSLFISQWFLLSALFWFPWIYSTAGILLVAKPVRGALQAALDWWYINNLTTIWFGFIGLAAAFYFIPKVTRRPLHSHYLGVFVFWTLAFFGSWGGIPHGSPLPAWMSAMSTMAAMLTLVPVIAVALMVRGTMAGAYSQLRESRPFKFILFGAAAYVTAGVANALNSTIRISQYTHFTWFEPALTQWFLYGFFAMTMFGAIYYIVPRLLAVEFPRPALICLQFACSFFGILFYSVPLALGGIKQGFAMYDTTKSFTDVMQGTLPFLRVSTLGDSLMLLGNLLLLLNLVGLLVTVARSCASAAWAANIKPAEVPS